MARSGSGGCVRIRHARRPESGQCRGRAPARREAAPTEPAPPSPGLQAPPKERPRGGDAACDRLFRGTRTSVAHHRHRGGRDGRHPASSGASQVPAVAPRGSDGSRRMGGGAARLGARRHLVALRGAGNPDLVVDMRREIPLPWATTMLLPGAHCGCSSATRCLRCPPGFLAWTRCRCRCRRPPSSTLVAADRSAAARSGGAGSG